MVNDYNLYLKFLDSIYTKELFEELVNTVKWYSELRNEQGESIKIKRKMAYMADAGVNVYHYANLSFPAQEWNPSIRNLKDRLGKFLKKEFNSVLLNYYENGRDQINWHADKEISLGENPVIACVNLGATRKFWFREQAPLSVKQFVNLADGDLFVMNENFQKKYLHAILKESEVITPRISLTFRYNYV